MTTTPFADFARLVRERFEHLTRNPSVPVFVTTATPDELYAEYLASFPDGTNPMFRARTEHDCSTCRQFIKRLSGIVTLRPDGSYQTLWDVEAEAPYDAVSARMAEFIRQHPIAQIYRTKEAGYGALATFEEVPGSASIRWSHLHGVVPAHLRTLTPDAAVGEAAGNFQVLQRGLEELAVEALDIVEDLITTGDLYRGEEHASTVRQFASLKRKYLEVPEGPQRANFVWQNLRTPAARFRNTAIGTLVQDISDGLKDVEGGVSVEVAVARFESKVAPTNYRRTSAPLTKAMIDKALEKLRELGLENAVKRRFAVVEDVSVADVLFVDRSMRPHMRDNLADLLMEEVTRAPSQRTSGSGAVDVTSEEFFKNVLPGASSVELELGNVHLGNFVSLTAPAESGSGHLFSWDNDFAWAYDGDVADSIKQRVKKAGGNVNALLRVSLSWHNGDDLDLHCHVPWGSDVFYGNKQGILDVDMNAGAAHTREPVENLAFQSLRNGVYGVFVNQFAKRESVDVGFDIEYEYGGEVRQYRYDRAVRQNENVQVITITVQGGAVTNVTPHASMQQGGTVAAEKWGLSTGQTVPVDMVVLSPNHWGPPEDRRGNKHHIFVLRGCHNPDRARGFFNEFLRPELHEHRKVFEILGSKTMCPPSEKQLSGVGFSSTRHDRATFVVRKDNTTRTYNVQF